MIPVERTDVETDLNWKTPPIPHEELMHTKYEYSVHSRGFTLDEDVWFDPYSVLRSHDRAWEQHIRHEYDKDVYMSLNELDSFFKDNILYWSITGAGAISFRHPDVLQLTEYDLVRTTKMFMDMDVDKDTNVSFPFGEDDHARVTAGWLYDWY